MVWSWLLGAVSSVSADRSQAAASTLESSVTPQVSGVLALKWRALFVAWKGMLDSPGFPLPELWQSSGLGSPSDWPEVVVAAAGSLDPVGSLQQALINRQRCSQAFQLVGSFLT